MHEILEAIVLGVVQGITEFLPVSSSGHLEITKVILSDDSLEKQSLFVTVLLHFATACSTVLVFRNRIKSLIVDIFLKRTKSSLSFLSFIIISMIPAAFVGIFFDDLISSLFNKNLILVGLMLLLTAGLLYLSERIQSKENDINFKNAFIIGLAQALAILPGLSRSGSTVATSLILGVSKEKAAEFSFLMVLPLIFGKIAKDLLSGDFMGQMPSVSYSIIGFISAFVTGVIACSWMISIIKSSKLKYFAIYCAIVGIIAISYSMLF